MCRLTSVQSDPFIKAREESVALSPVFSQLWFSCHLCWDLLLLLLLLLWCFCVFHTDINIRQLVFRSFLLNSTTLLCMNLIYCELQAHRAGESQESEDRASVCPAAPLSPPPHSPL